MADDESKLSSIPSALRKRASQAAQKASADSPKIIPEEPKKFALPSESTPPSILQGSTSQKSSSFEPKKDLPYYDGSEGGSSMGSGMNMLPVIVAVIAVILAIGSVYYAWSTVGAMKAEMREIAGDVKAIRDSSIPITTSVEGNVEIAKEIPASDAFPKTINIPLKGTATVSGTVVVSTAMGIQELPATGTLNIDQIIVADVEGALKDQKIEISESIPISKSSMGISVKGIWGKQLDSIIEKLEAMAG
ncbi:MAG: hypothetical protein ABIH99_03395 [Candidatus Micrarchaeota archaeon]